MRLVSESRVENRTFLRFRQLPTDILLESCHLSAGQQSQHHATCSSSCLPFIICWFSRLASHNCGLPIAIPHHGNASCLPAYLDIATCIRSSCTNPMCHESLHAIDPVKPFDSCKHTQHYPFPYPSRFPLDPSHLHLIATQLIAYIHFAPSSNPSPFFFVCGSLRCHCTFLLAAGYSNCPQIILPRP